MVNGNSLQSLRRLRSYVRAAALLLPLMAATGAVADLIKKEDMLRGVTMTHAQCAAVNQAVWVKVDGREFCVRYYLSTAGGEGARPVVFLQGDKLGAIDPKTWTWKNRSEAKDVDTEHLMEMANGFSKLAKTTAIYLARIGVDGSSGNHSSRKTVLELDLMNAALDAIKQRYGFKGFHLAGQSGGATLVGSLIGVRNDIVCAAPGSGRLAALADYKPQPDLGRTFFDPSASIALLARKPALRILVVTDPADKTVPAKYQSTFVRKLRQAGGHAEQLFVEATDEDHHGVVEYTRLAIAGCVLGKPDAEIARAVSTVARKNADWNAVRAAEARTKAPTGTVASQQPGTSTRSIPGAAPARRPGNPA